MKFSLTLAQLETLCAVVRNGSTVSAAQDLFTSQSSISKTLSRLEENLGFDLFTHQRGKLELTEAGTEFARSAQEILLQLEHSIEEAQLTANTTQSTLQIAGSSYLTYDLMSKFNQLHPNIRLNLQLYHERHMKHLLDSKEAQLILSTDPRSFAGSLYHWFPLMSCEILVVIPKCHPLAKKETIYLQDLENIPFVCNNIGLNGGFIRYIFKANKLQMKNLVECNDDRVFNDYMQHYDRLTFIPSYALVTTSQNTEVREARIANLQFQQHYGFVYSNEAKLSPLLKEFIEHSKSYCHELERQSNNALKQLLTGN